MVSPNLNFCSLSSEENLESQPKYALAKDDMKTIVLKWQF